MRIVVHPSYKQLHPFLEDLPESFPILGKRIYQGRNEIRTFQDGGTDYAVKSFQVPHFINRMAYTFIRPSKAERSYTHALQLQRKGIPTPQPVAFVERKSFGLLSESYYISIYQNVPTLIQALGDHPLKETKAIAEAFARYTAQVHEKGILHKDYSLRNILYTKDGDNFLFYLIDINRMNFVEMDMEKSARNLCRLWCDSETFTFIAQIYAGCRDFDTGIFSEKALAYRKSYQDRFKKRHTEIFQPYGGKAM